MFNSLKSVLFILCFLIPFSLEASVRDQYSGVVQLHLTDGSQPLSFSSAVFIKPNILVTAAHGLYPLKNEKNLFFKNPKTQKLVPVKQILHLDLKYDLAILDTGNYYSKTFYSTLEKNDSKLLDEITLVGFPQSYFNSIKGHILGHEDHFTMTSTLFFDELNGTSGGGVFNNHNELIGIVIRGFALPFTMQFISATKVEELLSKKALTCSFVDCLNKKLTDLILEAEKDNRAAQYSLAMFYYTQSNINLAIKWFKQAAENGSVLAKYNLANLTFIGRGIKKDAVKAIDMYKEIAHELVFAAYRIGFIHLTGVQNIIPVDKNIAFDWIKRAAEKDFFKAECLLGMLYYEKAQETTNIQHKIFYFKEAFFWIKRAADKGYSRAELQLAIMYHYGEGVEQNNDQAIIWAEKAAQMGLREAKVVLNTLKGI